MLEKQRKLNMTDNRMKFGFILALSFIVIPSFAQSPEEIEAKMDEIKLNEKYIYGEDYNNNKDIAYDNALWELLSSANEIRAEKGLEMLKAPDLQPVIEELRYSKDQRFTVFVYIPLSLMLNMNSKSHLDVVPHNDHIRKNDSSSSAQVQDKPEVKNPTPASDHTPVQSPETTPLPNDILMTLSVQDNWIEIRGFLSQYKRDGKIKETGNTQNFEEVPNDAYSILIDEMGGILSILSPKNSPHRINYKTNKQDNETNHPNCKFIVWYK